METGVPTIADERWRPLVLQAMRQENAAGLDKPEGLPRGGRLGVHYYVRRNGVTKHALRYQTASATYTLGSWFTARPPARNRFGMARGGPEEGRRVAICCGDGEIRYVRTTLDPGCLPRPVPEELYERLQCSTTS